MFGGGPIAKSLDQLAEGPDRGGVVGDVEVEDLAAIVPEDDEHEEQPERERRHHEEVDGHQIAQVDVQKGTPRRRGSERGPTHVLGDGQLGDLVAE